MKHISPLLIPLVLSLATAGCVTSSSSSMSSTVSSSSSSVLRDQGNLSVFPLQQNGFVGDPMPYFDGEKMNVFYLHDARDGQKGFHPWYLFQTTDFLNWNDQGEVIPYVNDYGSQDLALGTGSVIQDQEGLYHAYYTGFNGTGNMVYYEKIQHATSTDLVNWTKHPEDGFYGGQNDFRDPYVIHMPDDNNQYWMLITSRYNGRGVIRLYKSTNLSSWIDHGIFFSNDVGTWNMECPTLIKFNDYWYLAFSEQGSNRVTHYRYTADLSAGWIKPTQDYFDGIGFYAGRIEKMVDRLFMMGWVGTKEYDYDGGNFNWAGNLVTHELKQKISGELYVQPVTEVVNELSHPYSPAIRSQTSGVISSSGQINFDPRSPYDYLIYNNLSTNTTKLTFTATIGQPSGRFGMTFYAEDEDYGPVNVVFNVDDQRLEFYNVTPSRLSTALPQISLPFAMPEGKIIRATALLEGQILSLYVNNQWALTTRMYFLADYPFGFFGSRSDVTVSDIAFYN